MAVPVLAPLLHRFFGAALNAGVWISLAESLGRVLCPLTGISARYDGFREIAWRSPVKTSPATDGPSESWWHDRWKGGLQMDSEGMGRRRAAASDATQIEVSGESFRGSRDKSLLRLGAVLGLLGFVVQIVMDRLHPHRVAPNDSVNVFREYAGSDIWTAVHIGQFVGTLFIVLAFVALASSLYQQPGLAGGLAVVGTVTAILVAAVFAVQMAVDGVALKAAIDTWVDAASPGEQSAAFQVAEAVRWTEKGLGGFFQFINGITLLALGVSIALGARYPKWIGFVGALAGIGFAAGGTVTAHTGFSPTAGWFLTPATVLLAVFVIGIVILMWRRSGRAERPA